MMPNPALENDRPTELAERLNRVRQRVELSCRETARASTAVEIVAVTKAWPVADIRLLASLGMKNIAENRVAEASEKASACSDLDVRWHFVGQIQRNKAAAVAQIADVVHSVDRESLVTVLDRGAQLAHKRLAVLLQIDLQDVPGAGGRGGCDPEQLLELAGLVERCEYLELSGVMAVAPLNCDPHRAHERLAKIHERMLLEHPGATLRSAGMSGDFEVAIAAGATHIRLGSVLLGRRKLLK